jgi:hypothetical protein
LFSKIIKHENERSKGGLRELFTSSFTCDFLVEKAKFVVKRLNKSWESMFFLEIWMRDN